MKRKIVYWGMSILFLATAVVFGYLYLDEKYHVKESEVQEEFHEKDQPTKSQPIDVSDYNVKDRQILSRAMQTYCDLNNQVEGTMVNILALADLQYTGEYEEEKLDLDLLLKKIDTISKLDQMDIAVSLGDLNMSTSNKEIGSKNLKDITPKFKNFSVPTLFTLGNHDRFIKRRPEFDITKEEYFDLTYSNVDSSWIFNEQVEKEPYYYKDIENKKMRIGILNSFSGGNYEYVIDDEQLRFIAEEMLNFSNKEKPEEWTIVFFIHTMGSTGFHNEEVKGADEFFSILTAYQNGQTFTHTNFVVDYTQEKRANIAAIFTGHHHLDYTLVKNGFLVIGIDSIRTFYNRGDNSIYSEYSDENTDTSFEIISIDTQNKRIYTTKVGTGENRHWNYN